MLTGVPPPFFMPVTGGSRRKKQRACNKTGSKSIYRSNTLHEPEKLPTMKRIFFYALCTAALLLCTSTSCQPEEEDYFLRWMLLNATDSVLCFSFNDGTPFTVEPGEYRLLGTTVLPPDTKPNPGLLFELHPEYRTLSVSAAPDGPILRRWDKEYDFTADRQFFYSSQWPDENRDSHDCDYVFRVTPEDIANE